MKYYCSKCFAKIEYKFNKPEKCPFCGFSSSFASAESTSGRQVEYIDKKTNVDLEAKKNTTKVLRVNETDSVDDEDGYFEVDAIPIIAPGAGIKIEIDKPREGVTIGQLIESSSKEGGSSNSDFGGLEYFRVEANQKDALEQFKKEASNTKGFIEIF